MNKFNIDNLVTGQLNDSDKKIMIMIILDRIAKSLEKIEKSVSHIKNNM